MTDLTALPLLTRDMFDQMRRSDAAVPRVAKRYGITTDQRNRVAWEHLSHNGLLGELYSGKGLRVRLDKPIKDEPDAPARGEIGTIRQIQWIGSYFQIAVDWESGKTLPLISNEDKFTLLPAEAEQA